MYQYRVNKGWNNYPATMEVTVDNKLYQILSILQSTNYVSDKKADDDCIFIHQTGVMSQDRGFRWVNLSTREYGQDIGMFYGGIPVGSQYVDLNMIRGEGVYNYDDLLRVA